MNLLKTEFFFAIDLQYKLTKSYKSYLKRNNNVYSLFEAAGFYLIPWVGGIVIYVCRRSLSQNWHAVLCSFL
jgi:hypothetical protein